MKDDPILARKTLPRSADPDEYPRVAMDFKVHGGLHYMRGNAKPYFSLTLVAHRKGFPNQCWHGGAAHDEILKHYPEFADLAALHLSDIDGVPGSAEANGWYWLAPYLGGMGERYHGGNSKYNFPAPAPADKPWQNYEHRQPTREECLKFFADHCHIPLEHARQIAARILETKVPNGMGQMVTPTVPDSIRANWAKECEALKPLWKEQADACIKRHGLRVYGDPWPAKAA